jgi:hypothetical protein
MSTTMVIIGCARSELSIKRVLRSGSLIPWLGFSSMTRNGNARANFFKKPAHVEKDCFSPEPLSFEMPYHSGANLDVLASWWMAEKLAEMGSAPLIFGNNGALSHSK